MWFEFLWQIFLLTCHCLKLLCTRILYVKPSTNKHFIFRYVQLKIFFCAAFWRLKFPVEVDKKRIFAKHHSKLRLDTLAWKSERTRAWFEARLNNNSMSPGVEKSFVIWKRCCFKAHLFVIRSPVYIWPVWSRLKKTHAKWDRWNLHWTLFASHPCKFKCWLNQKKTFIKECRLITAELWHSIANGSNI